MSMCSQSPFLYNKTNLFIGSQFLLKLSSSMHIYIWKFLTKIILKGVVCIRRKLKSFIALLIASVFIPNEQNYFPVICNEMPKGWMMAIPEKVKAEQINLKLYSISCLLYRLICIWIWFEECAIAMSGNWPLLFSDTEMVTLHHQKPTESTMCSDDQERDPHAILNDHKSRKCHFQNYHRIFHCTSSWWDRCRFEEDEKKN